MANQYGLVFDSRRCISCYTCVVACKVENDLQKNSWMRLENSNGLAPDVPSGKYPNLKLSWRPITCMHCKEPPCQKACPEEAISKRPDGIVQIDKEKCTGCQMCVPACPYNVILFNARDNVASKCNLCSHRIDEGLEPFCAKECIWGAIHFGDVGDPDSEVSKLIAKRKGHTLKSENDTHPSNYYIDA